MACVCMRVHVGRAQRSKADTRSEKEVLSLSERITYNAENLSSTLNGGKNEADRWPESRTNARELNTSSLYSTRDRGWGCV